ncbi:serum amyloid A-3 protein-like [Brienomyrus brachyistius]|uniref:serum amyloid A-3 protein-like n=1 Tax=Brienomyrus brachyistius TaxID=42636 RepID=UPI0020B3A670|nr:serum amyloid A-3 protein-like [Brienomyrus brachyistius]
MKLVLAGLVLVLVAGAQAQWYKFPGQAIQGSRDMWRAYSDMREANWKNSDKYFHARGNYDAASRGPGGRWAAGVISNAREMMPGSSGRGKEDSEADQKANRWGRNGGDPNVYRPRGLPNKYMKLVLAGLVLVLVAGAQAQWYKFPGQAIQGSRDMWRAYSDMKEAEVPHADKYFHARGNYDAANRGPGGRWAAAVISNGREMVQGSSGRGKEDSEADQEANRWGRNGGDPNVYRPKGLPSKY